MGKRICKDNKVEDGFKFQLKANMINSPYESFFLTSGLAIILFAYIIRIFERPYWYSIGRLDFSSIGDSIWLVIISMTTVGYGNMYPATWPGRGLMIIAIIFGAFLMALLVSIITMGFLLEDNKK